MALNEIFRLISRSLKTTSLKYIYPLAGIAQPDIRRHVDICIERTKRIIGQSHSICGYLKPRRRLKSRKSFIDITIVIQEFPTSSDYVNGEKNYELKYLSRLMNDYHLAETYHGPYEKR
jgi:hypothetical protein